MELFEGLPYLGLFFACFLAATIVPFSSEAILGTMVVANFNPLYCFVVATAGNWLGGITSYGLGYFGKTVIIENKLKVKTETLDKMEARIKGRADLAALLTWAPFIGDVIAIVLGLMKRNFFRVAVYMLIGKAARYMVVIWLILKGKALI